jgi:hypothetical protein
MGLADAISSGLVKTYSLTSSSSSTSTTTTTSTTSATSDTSGITTTKVTNSTGAGLAASQQTSSETNDITSIKLDINVLKEQKVELESEISDLENSSSGNTIQTIINQCKLISLKAGLSSINYQITSLTTELTTLESATTASTTSATTTTDEITTTAVTNSTGNAGLAVAQQADVAQAYEESQSTAITDSQATEAGKNVVQEKLAAGQKSSNGGNQGTFNSVYKNITGKSASDLQKTYSTADAFLNDTLGYSTIDEFKTKYTNATSTDITAAQNEITYFTNMYTGKEAFLESQGCTSNANNTNTSLTTDTTVVANYSKIFDEKQENGSDTTNTTNTTNATTTTNTTTATGGMAAAELSGLVSVKTSDDIISVLSTYTTSATNTTVAEQFEELESKLAYVEEEINVLNKEIKLDGGTASSDQASELSSLKSQKADIESEISNLS